MKFKKLLLVSFIVLVLIGIFIYGLLTGKKQTEKEEVISKIPSVNIPKSYKAKINYFININKDQIEIPATLPLLKISFKEVDQNLASSYAKQLGFTKEVLISKDVREGTKYIWSDEKQYLFVTPSTNTIKYGLSIPEPPDTVYKNLSNEQIMDIAKDFLVKNFFIPEDQIEAKSINFYSINPKTEGYQRVNKDNAVAYQVNLSYKNSGYEILTLNPNKPLAFVNILPDGSVFNSEIILVNSVEKTSESYSILNYDELISNLNKAIVINIMNDYISLQNIREGSIKSIEVQNIKIAYLYDQIKTDTLQPVFLLEGKADISNTEADFAQLYLLAIKNP